MRVSTCICIFILLGLTCTVSKGQKVNFNDWQLDETVGDLKIYSKDSTGSLKKFGAEFTMQANLNDALYLLKTVDDYEDWIEGIHDAVSIGTPGKSAYSYHFYINKKILLGLYEIKKDGIVNSVVTKKDNYISIESNIDRNTANEKGYDRIEHYQVKWTFVPLANGKVKVYYQGLVDVQVNFAYQIIKASILENLEGTFNNMKKKLELLYAKH